VLTEKAVLWARVDLFPEEPAAELESDESSPSLGGGVEVEE
jgi:hypothetical protein